MVKPRCSKFKTPLCYCKNGEGRACKEIYSHPSREWPTIFSSKSKIPKTRSTGNEVKIRLFAVDAGWPGPVKTNQYLAEDSLSLPLCVLKRGMNEQQQSTSFSVMS